MSINYSGFHFDLGTLMVRFVNNVLSTAQQVWLRKLGGAQPVVSQDGSGIISAGRANRSVAKPAGERSAISLSTEPSLYFLLSFEPGSPSISGSLSLSHLLSTGISLSWLLRYPVSLTSRLVSCVSSKSIFTLIKTGFSLCRFKQLKDEETKKSLKAAASDEQPQTDEDTTSDSEGDSKDEVCPFSSLHQLYRTMVTSSWLSYRRREKRPWLPAEESSYRSLPGQGGASDQRERRPRNFYLGRERESSWASQRACLM